MINDDVKAAEQNMAAMINNIVNQIEGDTGMAVRSVSVDRGYSTKDKAFRANIALEVKK